MSKALRIGSFVQVKREGQPIGPVMQVKSFKEIEDEAVCVWPSLDGSGKTEKGTFVIGELSTVRNRLG